jgi:hypothetical protein
MTARREPRAARVGILAIVLLLASASIAWAHETPSADGATPAAIATDHGFVSESAMLKGLGAGALYPFIDSTPRRIVRAHIAVTDSTNDCSAGGGAPDNVVILVGEAGVALKSVLTKATNTGIGSNDQCVFHVTVRPGHKGVPNPITDIVVVNDGSAALTGYNTVTASAIVK